MSSKRSQSVPMTIGTDAARGGIALAATTAALTIGLLAVVVQERAAASSFPGDNGRIAYSQLNDPNAGNFQIRSVLPTGTGVEELTPPAVNASYPSYSADGEFIAFWSNPGAGDGEIFRMRANGKARTRLTANRRNELQPSWAPNGKRIVFVRITPRGHGELFTMNRSGQRLSRLTSNRISKSVPAWSPNGRWIAFTGIDRTRNRTFIYKVRRNGRNLQRLTVGASPSWSPNGKKIAYTRTPQSSGDSEIFTIRQNGRGIRRLTTDPLVPFRNDLHPAWAPEGRWIAFARNGELWRIRPNGNSMQQVLVPSDLLGFPTWQPR